MPASALARRIGLAVVLSTPALGADVLTVDASLDPGDLALEGHFPNVQAAVDHASDGDVIFVLSGTYDSFVIGDLDVALFASPGVVIDRAIDLVGLSAGKRVVLHGFEVEASFQSKAGRPGLLIDQCQGSVFVERCEIEGSPADNVKGNVWDVRVGAGVEVRFSPAVALVDCRIRGGVNAYYGAEARGVLSTGSQVAVLGTQCWGGGGKDYVWKEPGGKGGAAGYAAAGTGRLVSVGSLWQGGAGGHGYEAQDCQEWSQDGGPGGHGLVGQGLVDMIASLALGGAGGHGGVGNCPPNGANGPNGQATVGSVVDHGRPTVTLDPLPVVVPSTTTLTVVVRGPIGDDVELRFDGVPDWRFEVNDAGVHLVPDPAAAVLQLGTIPGSGMLVAQIQVPLTASEPRIVHAQVVSSTAGLWSTVGTARTFLLVP